MSSPDAEPSLTVTRLLLEWSDGNAAALDSLLPLVYEELRAMAARHLRKERQAHTLQRTALVHEAYLRLVDQKRVAWHNRAHFLAIASQMMRRVLVDHARKHLSQKRGGELARLSPDTSAEAALVEHTPPNMIELTQAPGTDLGAIDEALKRLEVMDPRQGKMIELRFFGGLTIDDTAAVLGVSPATVKREWSSARAWLQRELQAGLRP